MIHTDVYYGRPVVYKLTTSLRDKYITLDSWMDPINYKQTNKDVVNTYLRPVSFVSNDAAVYPDWLMDNLQYIHEQLCYAEDQRELADDMYSMQAWDQRIDALQCAYNFIADQGVSKEARESVPQVLTVTYN